MVWNGKVLSQTMDGDVHTYTYRIDLFENPDNQKAFKAKYGYDLAPPKTWKQYLDIAEFFQQPDKGLWGTAEAFRRGGQQFWFSFQPRAGLHQPSRPSGRHVLRSGHDGCADQQSRLGARPRGIYPRLQARAAQCAELLLRRSERGVCRRPGGQVHRLGRYRCDRCRPQAVEDRRQCRLGHPAGFGRRSGTTRPRSGTNSTGSGLLPFMAFGGWQAAVPPPPRTGSRLELTSSICQARTVSGQAVVTGGTGVNPYRCRI